MAFMVAFTSFGYAVDLHFCQGHLKGFSLLGKAKNCHEKMAKCPNHSPVVKDSNSNDCCSNKTVQVENLDEEGLLVLDVGNVFSLTAIEVIPPVLSGHRNNFLKLQKPVLRPPPLIQQNLYLFLETFLL
jgi:hypothetical protein